MSSAETPINWKRNLTVTWLGCFLTGAAFSLVMPFLPLYVEQLGVTGHRALNMWSGLVFSITFLFSAIAGFILSQWSVFDCMAVGSGFAYYSISSVLITQLKTPSMGLQVATELGTIALLANIFREMTALVGAPFIRKHFGRRAPISAAGIGSSDILLAAITQYSGKDAIPLAILHGILINLSVPFFVSLFCNL